MGLFYYTPCMLWHLCFFSEYSKTTGYELKTSKVDQGITALNSTLKKSLVLGALHFIVMVMIMTATPLGMKHHHFEMSDITQVIQFHVLGMFVPSLFLQAVLLNDLVTGKLC